MGQSEIMSAVPLRTVLVWMTNYLITQFNEHAQNLKMQGKPYNVRYKRITEERRNISAGVTAVEKEMLLIVG